MRTQIAAEPAAPAVAELGEGPVWDVDTGEMVWVDILGRRIHRLDFSNRTIRTEATPEAVGAVIPADDGWLAAMPEGIHRIRTWERLADLPATIPKTRANDGKVDPWGSLVLGTMGWAAEVGAGSLFRLRADRFEVLLAGLTISNGLDWTEDRRTMYHIDTPTRQVMAYEYRPDGPLGGGKVALDLTDAPGDPDGMCLDTDGCLWVALWGGGCVNRYTPDGRLDRQITVPATKVSSCAFGGPQLDTLLITTARPAGEQHGELDGRLFVADPGTFGRPPNRIETVQ